MVYPLQMERALSFMLKGQLVSYVERAYVKSAKSHCDLSN